MDHKAWPWKKKSVEKSFVEETHNAIRISSKGNMEEIEKLKADKTELEKNLKHVSDKLTSLLAECNAKDVIVKKHENDAHEALIGLEKTKAEAASLRRKLDDALNEKNRSEERTSHLDAGLKECMQQLRFVREEQERRMHGALTKTSKEYENQLGVLEEKLTDTRKRLAQAEAENTRLTNAVLAKNEAFEDLNRERDQIEADFNILTNRLGSKEKENASLKYEIRVLEKELEIRNEEREFSRRSGEASHKLHLENVKKIAKLEAECQRLRILVRKRLPGPAALAKMKNEVGMLGRDSLETRRRRFHGNPTGVTVDSERINNLTEQLCLMEEENRTLREAINKKINELQFSRSMYSRTASKLLEFESHLEEPLKSKNMEPRQSSNDVSLASVSEFDHDDKVSCADSWASALLSELENFKNNKQTGSGLSRNTDASDMKLMDDFAEMEKLAMVSVDNPTVSSSPIRAFDSISATGPVDNESNEHSSVRSGEMITITKYSNNSDASPIEVKSDQMNPPWLDIVLKTILEHKHISQRNTDEILEDIRKALSSVNHLSSTSFFDAKTEEKHHESLNLSKQTESSILEDNPRGESSKDASFSSKCYQDMHYDISKEIRKVIEIIEGVSLDSPVYTVPEISRPKDEKHLPNGISDSHSGYTVRVLQWKTSELSSILQRFLRTCYDLLNRKADINSFAKELSSALDWIVNHCFSLQDVSSMREEIKKQFDWDESQSESETEIGSFSEVSEVYKSKREDISSAMASNDPTKGQYNMEEDMGRGDSTTDKETAKKYCKGRSSSLNDKDEITEHQLREPDKRIKNLQKELETLRNSMAEIEGGAECYKLPATSGRELKAEYAKSTHEMASVLETEVSTDELNVGDKQPIRSEREITAASEKLAECQETIQNLGKQLKALSESKEVSPLSDPVMSEPTQKSNKLVVLTSAQPSSETKPEKRLTQQRSSLLDKMKADDNGDSEQSKDQNPPEDKNGKGGIASSTYVYNETIEVLEHILFSDKGKGTEKKSYAIVPQKKASGVKSLWKKLLWRKKKGNSKKLLVPFAPT